MTPLHRSLRQWLEIALAIGALGVSLWLVWAWVTMPGPPVRLGVVVAVQRFYQFELIALAGVGLLALGLESTERPPRLEWLWMALGAQAAIAVLGIWSIGSTVAAALALGALAGVSAARRVGTQVGRLLMLAAFAFLVQGLLMIGIVLGVSSMVSIDAG